MRDGFPQTGKTFIPQTGWGLRPVKSFRHRRLKDEWIHIVRLKLLSLIEPLAAIAGTITGLAAAD